MKKKNDIHLSNKEINEVVKSVRRSQGDKILNVGAAIGSFIGYLFLLFITLLLVYGIWWVVRLF